MLILPALTFCNLLPCAIEIEWFQATSPITTVDIQSEKLYAADGAQELFFLPDTFYTQQESDCPLTVDAQRPSLRDNLNLESFLSSYPNDSQDINSLHLLGFSLFSRVQVLCGDRLEIPHVFTDRTFYFRMRLPCTELWSELFSLPVYIQHHRSPFHKHKPELVRWNYKDQSPHAYHASSPPQIHLLRLWPTLRSRQIDIFAKYWLINKSGLFLKYSMNPVATDAISMRGLHPSDNLSHPSTFDSDWLTDTSHSSLEYDNIEYGEFISDSSIPIMTNLLASSQISILPTVPMSAVIRDENPLYIYDVHLHNLSATYRLYEGLWIDLNTIPVIINPLSKVQWPPSLCQNANEKSDILTVDISSNNFYSSTSELSEILSFKASCDCYVHLCICTSSSILIPPLPKWFDVFGYKYVGENVTIDEENSVKYQVRKLYCTAHIFYFFFF